MEDIKPVVDQIVSRCAGFDVSETLAAFVARMVVYENPERFRVDKPLTEDGVAELVELSARFLQQKDSPSLETVRMQVAFDGAYFKHHTELEQRRFRKDKKRADLQADICAVTSRSASDFEVMTGLYQKVFTFLAVHADSEGTGAVGVGVQREIAAALESVFPRVGLKSFVALSQSEKASQLAELARLILGIRLFNREVGKGGEGLEDVPVASREEASALLTEVSGVLDDMREVCQQYSDVLVFAHLRNGRDPDAKEDEGDAEPEGVAGRSWPDTKARWKDELTNRRQLAAYVKSLAEEVGMSLEAIKMSSDALEHELEDLKRMVGARSSVPKEQVYPKFSALAGLWTSLEEHRQRVASRAAIFRSLDAYRDSHVSTLTLDWVHKARKARLVPTKPPVVVGDISAEAKEPDAKGAPGPDAAPAPAPSADESAVTAAAAAGGGGKAPEAKEDAGASGAAGGAGGAGGDDEDVPVRLSLESTPEFMQLPLEYQGYCAWTVVHRGGLLLPGDPSLGVVKYRNTFNVFTSEEALQAFMAAPRRYVDGVIMTARRNPELVHLLQLQVHFPEAALPTIIRGAAGLDIGGGSAADGPPVMRDAATETPTHFVEKHIDPRYEWNEWALRRKALQLANLKQAATVSAQTDMSHFRRENESQVYLQRDKTTNTGVSTGTNPARVHRYITGLRGGTTVVTAHDVLVDAKAKRDPVRAMGRSAAAKAPTRAAVVSLKYDL